MRTKVCDMFGIEAPIFAFSHCRDVVVEVSKAGGLGVLGGGVPPEQLEIELNWIDRHINGKPYGIDFLMPSIYANTDEAIRSGAHDLIPQPHREWTETLLSEHNVPPLPPAEIETFQRTVLDRAKITPRQHKELLEVTFSHPVKLIATALGKPPPELVVRAHDLGIKIGALVGTPEHAARQRDAGVDIIIAQGTEAGGHTGSIATMVLVPQVVDLVAPLPVLAAGGIASGRQMAAAMALGADGVWCGSVWLATSQSDIDPKIIRKILAASSADAVVTKSMTGKTVRALKSAWTEAWSQPDAPQPLMMPMQGLLAKEVMKRSLRANADELLSHPAGQVIGQISGKTSVRQVVYDMLREFADTIERLDNLVD
jgi:NAD(P)H-dependent flavin oxidoreductase YrpB (nitropropane dioxygenase family)